MPKKSTVPTVQDTFDLFRSSLQRFTVNPTINAYKPMDGQKKFHESRARGKVYLGGNRAGKTVAGGTETVQRMLGCHPNQKYLPKPPIKARGIASSIEEGLKKIMIPEIQRWVPPSQLKNGNWDDSYDKESRTLTLENKSTLEFLTYEQDVQKHAGTSRNFVWFDEEPPEDIFDENMVRLIDVDGEWCLTMTPLIDMSWTYERLFIEGSKEDHPGIEVFHASTVDNIYINHDTLDILTVGMDEEQKEARKHGTYFNLSGGIYSSSLTPDNYIDNIIIGDQWDLYYNHWGHFGMLDHGWTNITAFHLGCYDEYGKLIIYDEFTCNKTLVKDIAKEIKARIKFLKLEEKLDYIVADPSTQNTGAIDGSSIRNEYAEHGVYLVMANNDVRAGISRVNAMLKQNLLLITDNCVNLKKELPQYRWAKYASSKLAQKRNLQEVPVKKNDHSLDAIRYGVMSRPQLFASQPQPVGNVMNVATATNNDNFIDVSLTHSYKQFDHPDVFDEILGNDW